MNASPPRTAAIVLIGDELLSGKVVDRNGQLLLRELRQLGVAVTELHVVPDLPERIVEIVDLVRGRNDVVFTSGGIGPTHDDRTLEAMAAAFGVELVVHAHLIEIIERAYGPDPDKLVADPESSDRRCEQPSGTAGESQNATVKSPWRKMAAVPRGCELIPFDDTRWPGYKLGNVYILPGIPEIFLRQFTHLKARFAAAPFHLCSLYARPHEGLVAQVLNRAVERFSDVAIGSYPELGNPDYKVRVTVEARDAAAVRAAVDWLVAQFAPADLFKVDL